MRTLLFDFLVACSSSPSMSTNQDPDGGSRLVDGPGANVVTDGDSVTTNLTVFTIATIDW